MRALHGLLTSISAITVLLLSASWFAEKFEIGPNLGLWEQPSWNPYSQFNKDTDGVPAIGKGKLSIPLSSPFGRTPWQASEGGTIIIPVSVGRADYGIGFSTFSLGSEQPWRSGGSCMQNTVNLLVVDQETPAGEPVFSRRVLLPKYFHFDSVDNGLVVALVVRNDTNGDGQLDCGDAARFELISLADGSTKFADRDFIPDDLSHVSFRDNNDEFVFTELKYEGENISIKSISVSLQDLSIKEVAAPDLLFKAKEAFEKTELE